MSDVVLHIESIEIVDEGSVLAAVRVGKGEVAVGVRFTVIHGKPGTIELAVTEVPEAPAGEGGTGRVVLAGPDALTIRPRDIIQTS